MTTSQRFASQLYTGSCIHIHVSNRATTCRIYLDVRLYPFVQTNMSAADRTSLDPSFVSESTSHQGHDTTRYPTGHLYDSTEGSRLHDPSLTQMQWTEQAEDSDLPYSINSRKGYHTVGLCRTAHQRTNSQYGQPFYTSSSGYLLEETDQGTLLQSPGFRGNSVSQADSSRAAQIMIGPFNQTLYTDDAETLPQAQFLVQQGFSPPDYPVPDIIPEGTDGSGHHLPVDRWDKGYNQSSFSHAWQPTFQGQILPWQMGLQQQQDIWEGEATDTCETLPILMNPEADQ